MPANRLPDVKLDEEQRTVLASWLAEQIETALDDRKPYEKEWLEIQGLYEKHELDEKKDFPFEGAAHIMLPIMATYSERMWAKIHRTIWAPRHPMSAKPILKQFVDAVEPLRDFMTWSIREELNLEDVTNDSVLELVKLGTCATKTVYSQRQETRFEYEEASKRWSAIPSTIEDNPKVIPVPLADFLFPVHVRKIEDAEWKAHRVRLRWGQLKAREAAGTYIDVERIKHDESAQLSEYDQHVKALDGVAPSHIRQEYEVWEIWFERDIGIDGEEVPLKYVASIHVPSRTLLRIQYNWYPRHKEPFDLCPFIRREHTPYGVGVGHMSLSFQKEISIMHNQRLDNATIKNVAGYKYKVGSMVGPNLKFQPGVGVAVDEMDDFDTFQWGQPFDSTLREEQHTLGYLRERIGLAELNMRDQIQATNAMMILAEAAGKSDMIIHEFRQFLSRVMEKVLLLYAKYFPDGKPYMTQDEDGFWVQQVLNLPEGMIEKGVAISVTATTSEESQELQRQGELALFNMLRQAYADIVQYTVQAFNPQVPPPIRVAMLEVASGIAEFASGVLDDFNIHNRDQLVGGLQRIVQLASQSLTAPSAADNGGQSGVGGVQPLPFAGAGQGGQGNQEG